MLGKRITGICVFFVVVLLLASTRVCAQAYSFRHYEVEAGLSNNAVICSAQDRQGFMWFGTRDGLNRFDGYHFKVYRFPENQVHSMYADTAGTLLVSTEKSIYRYNALADTFVLSLSFKYSLEEIVADGRGNIWFNANHVLYRFSEKTGELKNYPIKASALSLDKDGVLWIGCADGFLKTYNSQNDTFAAYDLFFHSPKTPNRYIASIKCTPVHKVLVGTDKSGFKVFNTQTLVYQDIKLCCETPGDLFIRCFLQVSPNEVWMGTETGIFSYNYLTGKSFKIQKNSSDGYSLSDNVVYTFCKDKEGGIWAGTYFGGINYFPRQYTPFQKFYRHSTEKPLSGNIVREITEDRLGNLWIGTEDGGLNKWDAQTRKMQYFKPGNTKQSISYICAHSLLATGNELWLGTFYHGLDILDIRTGKVIKHYDESSKNGLNSSFPFSFIKTKNEVIVAAFPGLYSFDPKKRVFSPVPHFPAGASYQYLLKDSQGVLWASAHGRGVMYYDEKIGKYGAYTFLPGDTTSLASDMVTKIFEDSRQNLWFATENGLCRFNRSKNNFSRYGTPTGFPSNFMLAMLEDGQGRLWISTTKGLACFDAEKNKVITYTTANGLLSDQFNFSSAYKAKDNNMYFGSAKGLISFNPDDFVTDTFIPPVFITGLQVNNKEVGASGENSPLQQSILYTPKISLRHNQSTIGLDFAALGYTAPQDLMYAYMLEGLTTDWTYVKKNRKVNFTQLQAGTYVFRVKAASTAGIWAKGETRLTIEVLPPWWASTAAFIVYVFCGLAALCGLFFYYHQRMKAKNRRAIERLEMAREKELLHLEIAREKEMLESKIEFYTQVAHEIRTPLTLIKIPLGKVVRKTEGMDEIKNSLKIINANTDRLIELSNQLLDFRQTELKAYSSTFERTDIAGLLQSACHNFTALAEQANISIGLEMPRDGLFASVDIDAFSKIVYNLLSNAVKYAGTVVEIQLKPSWPGAAYFTVYIKNDGHIVPQHLKEKIFEPFFRIKETEAKTGSGIGLALARSIAEAHNGSLTFENHHNRLNVFILTLPINPSDKA